jgi:hypothetical protein
VEARASKLSTVFDGTDFVRDSGDLVAACYSLWTLAQFWQSRLTFEPYFTYIPVRLLRGVAWLPT